MENRSSRNKYVGIKSLLIVLLFISIIILISLFSINIFGFAFKKLGFPPEYSIYFLFLSLPGSFINIPIKTFMPQNISIAVNAGGAVIPAIMSIFLARIADLIDVVIGVSIMTIILNRFSHPVKGSGIRIHAFIPPFLASMVALLISPENAPLIAYISGTIGCLIGVDLVNLRKINEMGVKVISIGGAGTFDAIYLTGIISVLLV